MITATIAALEALVLLGYGASIAVVAITAGINGPQAVASPTGVAVETVVFVLFGVGMALVAAGRWRNASWSTVPFVVAQLLALTVGIPLVTASGWPRLAGVLTAVAAVVGVGALGIGRARTPEPVDVRVPEDTRIDPPRGARH